MDPLEKLVRSFEATLSEWDKSGPHAPSVFSELADSMRQVVQEYREVSKKVTTVPTGDKEAT